MIAEIFSVVCGFVQLFQTLFLEENDVVYNYASILHSYFKEELLTLQKDIDAWNAMEDDFKKRANSSIRFLKRPHSLHPSKNPLLVFLKKNKTLAIAMHARLFRNCNIIFDLLIDGFEGHHYLVELFETAGVKLNSDTFECRSPGWMPKSDVHISINIHRIFDRYTVSRFKNLVNYLSKNKTKVSLVLPFSISEILHYCENTISKYNLLVYFLTNNVVPIYIGWKSLDSHPLASIFDRMLKMELTSEMINVISDFMSHAYKINPNFNSLFYEHFFQRISYTKDPFNWMIIFSSYVDFNTMLNPSYYGTSPKCTLIENIISLIYNESCNGIYLKIFDYLLSRSDIKIPKSFAQYNEYSIYCYYRDERQLFSNYRCLNCNMQIAEREQTIIQKLQQELHFRNRIEETDMFRPDLKKGTNYIQLFTSFRYDYEGYPIDCCDCGNMRILSSEETAKQVWLIFKRLGLPHVDGVIFEISSYFPRRRKSAFRQLLR